MPVVRIELSPKGVTKEQKRNIISGITRLLTDVLNKDPKLTHVLITELDGDDWGYDGQQVSEIINQDNE